VLTGAGETQPKEISVTVTSPIDLFAQHLGERKESLAEAARETPFSDGELLTAGYVVSVLDLPITAEQCAAIHRVKNFIDPHL
jgi:hypothetical protein